MEQKVIIVPLTGLTVNVSEDRNAVTIDGADKVKGYALSGDWIVESEDTLWPWRNWYWHGVVHAPRETVPVATETLYALFFLLRRSDMEYAILTRREDGRYYFLYGHDAAVSNWEAGNQCEIVFDGYLPYPTTVYGGEVEVVGDVVPGLLDHIYETRGGCGKVWHGKDERPEDDSQILIVDDDGRVRLGNTLQTVTTSLRQPAA